MPLKLAIAGLLHETNTFCSTPTQLDDFTVRRGESAITAFKGTGGYVGGMLAAVEELGGEAVCGAIAYADPSGVISAAAYDALKEDLLSDLAAALPVDAVALSLHGAGIAVGVDDIELDLCRDVRRLVGEGVPIVATLDLHGNMVQELGDVVDVMLGVREYPHIDMAERGHEAVKLLPRLINRELQPVTHVERLPMLLPPTCTFDGPMAEVNEICARLEALPAVIDVTLFHGFPYTDVPHVGAAVVAITDGDADLARRCAVEVAAEVWARRDGFLVPRLSGREAVARALESPTGPIIINETSDNPGGGTPGDGTHLLRAMLEARVTNSCFGFIVDPEVAAAAHRAGVGATIDVRLGGKTDTLHGEPIPIRAQVRTLTDGEITLQAVMAGERIELGRSARIVVDDIDVIVTSRRFQTLDPEVFLLHGIDVRRYRIVALKSSHHFRAGFAGIAADIVTADDPGLTTGRIEVFERSRVSRPIWPLDLDAVYVPSTDHATPIASR